MNNKILGAIIVYNPDSTLLKLVDDLLLQGVDVFLFINNGNRISDKLIKSGNVDYYISFENVGISKAFNKVIKKFQKAGYKYLFAFDQDSLIENKFIKSMISNFDQAYKLDKKVVCCAPTIMDRKYSKSQYIIKKPKINYKNYERVSFAITSGSLYTHQSFKKVGLMNELLFIDGVDVDWCERANLNKYIIIKSRNVFLHHKIGQKYINFFGIKKSFHDDNLRVYYIVRNSIYLILRGTNSVRWKIIQIIKTPARLIGYAFLSENLKEAIRFEFFAIRDAIKGDMEKMKYIKH